MQSLGCYLLRVAVMSAHLNQPFLGKVFQHNIIQISAIDRRQVL